ncbi:hypothetical protein B0T26DRAFT_728166 [Lasiosphaeria miniovina]|uniref:Uncharacterized protein n=1 Tax=Lasiosphaeria miniovina TaxID=1954250 RepID=A0AA40DKR3_9PEZI|nr:uncharacterized protein B0T26DRAFT_728166 [Lasiosphaeria miniovina]KAK0706820.1 hypothetical protein B0T26DRAFT_728166 [Lasiosphaeria miniovina]
MYMPVCWGSVFAVAVLSGRSYPLFLNFRFPYFGFSCYDNSKRDRLCPVYKPKVRKEKLLALGFVCPEELMPLMDRCEPLEPGQR